MNNETKKYKIVIHDKAAQMLYRHVGFVANVSVSAAGRLRETLYKSMTSLETMPYRCPEYFTVRVKGAYRKLAAGRYQIIFSVNEEENIVNIRYILDSRQDNKI
jgi:plasmid stabilization system protein ParE